MVKRGMCGEGGTCMVNGCVCGKGYMVKRGMFGEGGGHA